MSALGWISAGWRLATILVLLGVRDVRTLRRRGEEDVEAIAEPLLVS